MSKTIRVNEYYDLFDVITTSGSTTTAPTNIPNNIKDSNEYNSFRGFSNWEDFKANNLTLDTLHPPNRIPVNIVEISGKYKSPQATSSIKVDENGDIWCYPPNVSVPYWSRIIFRNFDYKINETEETKDRLIPDRKTYDISGAYTMSPWTDDDGFIPKFIIVEITQNDVDNNWTTPDGYHPLAGEKIYLQLWGIDIATTYKVGDVPAYPENFPDRFEDKDYSELTGFPLDLKLSGTSKDYSNSPLFLRFDEYPSRSKVIFSSCDKTRNPDIEFSFSYHKGQMEPIKLNLSLSANVPVNDFTTGGKYNQNLSKSDIEDILKSCYWCIEWICDKDVGN